MPHTFSPQRKSLHTHSIKGWIEFGCGIKGKPLISLPKIEPRIYKTTFLPVFSCFVWVQNFVSCLMGKNIRLRVSENRVMRGIFGPKREEITGGRRKLHNEEIHSLCCSPNVIRVIKTRRMDGHVM
jgi:hypothetical protein